MSTVSTVTPSNNWSYDRMMRLFGGMWFMLLALCVATKIAASLTDPWPSLLSNFCLASFYLLVALLIMTRSPAKAQADGLLPRIAAFVGSYLPWTITFFGQTDQALPNLLSTACVLIGMIMMLVTIRHLGRSFSLVPQARSVVQTGPLTIPVSTTATTTVSDPVVRSHAVMRLAAPAAGADVVFGGWPTGTTTLPG